MRSSVTTIALIAAATASGLAAEAPRPARTERVLMRDGVHLATDIYLPEPERAPAGGTVPAAIAGPRWPCLLVRTPYGRTRYAQEFGTMARWGYAVAIQDTRGRFDSGGEAWGFDAAGWRTQQDGYDTVEWLAKQPYSNGRVATLGASAMGIDQLLLAPTAPPALRCQYVLVAAASVYHHSAFVGGVLREDQVTRWLAGNANPGALARTTGRATFDDFWRELDSRSVAGRVRVPAIHYGGWYDTFSQGTIDAFLSRQRFGGEGARGRQKLVLGPWTHGGPGKREFGEFDLPEPARQVPWDVSARRWFDHHLKGVPNGAEDLPPVMYYVLGPLDDQAGPGNRWRWSARWPPAALTTSLWLGAARELSRVVPRRRTGLGYTYDPDAPTPTLGGRNLFLDAGPRDQRPVESRDDVLVFTSEPLAAPLEITGRVRAEVFVSSSAGAGDVAVRVCDVYPDGRSILLLDGIRRWRAAAASEPVRVDVDLWSISAVIASGHRLRVSVASANHPRWSAWRPPRSGDEPVRVEVHTGGDTPSQLVLPVVSTPTAR